MTFLRHSLGETLRAFPQRFAQQQPLLWWALLSAVAGALAWLLGSLPFLGQPVPAAIAAVLTVTLSVRRSVRSGGTLLLATATALAAAWALYHLFGMHAWTVGVLIAISLGIGALLRLSPEASLQIPVTALFLYALGNQLDNEIMVERIGATLLGVGLGIAFSLLARPIDPYQRQKALLSSKLGELLEQIGTGCAQPYTREQAAQWLRQSRVLLAQAHELQAHRGTGTSEATTDPDHEVASTVHTAELLNAIARTLSDAADHSGAVAIPSPLGDLLASAGASVSRKTDASENADDAHHAYRRAVVGEVKNIDDTGTLVLSASILADIDQIVGQRNAPAAQRQPRGQKNTDL